jgi:hypothetical protein
VSLSAEPIDAVITWVDGRDPAHAQRLAAYLAEIGGARPAAAHPTRFDDAGEIDWCVASILRFAPWMRTIHIVADRQTPALIARLRGTPFAGRVRVVDHREIFAGFEQCLPTFNSRAIITALWRMPELAEHFVYFNDDFVLLRPVAPADFFRDGRVVLRGRWQPQSTQRPLRRALMALRRALGRDPAQTRVRNLAAQEDSARLAGYEREYLRMYHNPFALRRETLRRFFAGHPDLLERNLSFRLRSPQQFKTEVLAAHLEFAQGAAVFDNALRTVQLKPAEQWFPRLRAKLARADRDPRCAFACVQSLDLAPLRVREHLIDWLNRRVGTIEQLVSDKGDA